MSKTKTKQNRQKNASEPTPIRPSSFIAMLKKYSTPLVAGLIIGLLLGLSMFYLGTYSKNEHGSPGAVVEDTVKQKTLLFAGGGSVVTYLNHKYSDSVIKHFPDIFNNLSGSYSKDSIFSMNYYPNSIYLHMPSGPALSLLVEEALMPDTRERQPFYPVCFSAMEANESLFTKTCTKEQIKDVGIILQYYIGDEHLTVYLVKNESLKINDSIEEARLSSSIKNKKITVDHLRDLLENEYYTVYSTSPESGTFGAYVKAIGDTAKCHLNSTEFYSCESGSDLFKKTNKPFMILGGEFYYPKKFKDQIEREDIHKLTLVDYEKDRIANPLYLYFMAYKDNNDNYIVTKDMVDLLKILGFQDDGPKPRFIKDPKDENLYNVYIEPTFTSLILPIN